MHPERQSLTLSLTPKNPINMSMVERWVGDKLHDILGISDKHIAQYLIGLAGKASSAEDFVQKLKDTGTVEVDTNMVNFCTELWNKVRWKYYK